MTELEQQLARAATEPRRLAFAESTIVPGDRVHQNLHAIHAELDAPPEPRLARILRRLGVPDLTIPVVTATPALRRSWFVAVAIAVLFALTTAGNATGVGVDRISVFLTLAPLVPLLGVALAFGQGVDPTHDLVVAAPRDTFTVFLVRSLTVLAASSVVLLATSAMLPAGGLFRLAWLLPSIAVSALALALSSRFAARRVALGIALSWLVIVLVVSGASSASAMFGPITQGAAALVAIAAVGFSVVQRSRFDLTEVRS